MICSGPSAPLLISAAQRDVDDVGGVHSVAPGHTHCLHPRWACTRAHYRAGPRVERAAESWLAAGASRGLAAGALERWLIEERERQKRFLRVFRSLTLQQPGAHLRSPV